MLIRENKHKKHEFSPGFNAEIINERECILIFRILCSLYDLFTLSL